MTYEQAIEKIHSLLTFGSRPGLDRMRIFLEKLGNPQDKLKYIHIAGTNGKGSVCAMLSAVLVEAGYKTGLFISPYITDFRERIQINNRMISKEMLTETVEKTFPIIEELRNDGVIITEFEYVNALQFYIHANEKCDIVVLETGMGGLLDCTNTILPPLCSVITTIGLDHTAILGNTIEEIAWQKCGIIKNGSIAVTSKQEENAMSVIECTCKSRNVELFKSESAKIKVISESLESTVFEYDGTELELHLIGEHQLENAKTALTALKALCDSGKINVSKNALKAGMAKAVNPARLELMGKNPVVLLDGAHNPNGIEALSKAVKKYLPNQKRLCLMGMLADKDSASSINLLEGLFEEVFTVTVNNPRTLSAEELAEKCKQHFPKVEAFDNNKKALETALDKAKNENMPLVICGSLYLAGELRPYLSKNG